MKRTQSLIGNPFIKKQNRDWKVDAPASLSRSISPPSTRAKRAIITGNTNLKPDDQDQKISPIHAASAAVEAGQFLIRDHLSYFSIALSARTLSPYPNNTPQIDIEEFKDLYLRNQNDGGRHFVIHQHDHPIAGVHYDLRLQISKTSSISFAIMYGLPGRMDSRRLNRNATETRVHNVWNHLIETASYATGSLLIWDTGEYEVLRGRSKHDPKEDFDSQHSVAPLIEAQHDLPASQTEPEKLFDAFKNRKIKLRLHGARLPKDYTLNLRLTKSENRTSQPKKPGRKRRRTGPSSTAKVPDETPPSSDAEPETTIGASDDEFVSSQAVEVKNGDTALEKELQEQEDEEVRRTNAYPGAENTIGSVHQRRWYLSLDRVACGFEKISTQPVKWARRKNERETEGFEPFFVMGRDVERSVVTGRNADEIMRDEGVVGYVGRKGWRPVLE